MKNVRTKQLWNSAVKCKETIEKFLSLYNGDSKMQEFKRFLLQFKAFQDYDAQKALPIITHDLSKKNLITANYVVMTLAKSFGFSPLFDPVELLHTSRHRSILEFYAKFHPETLVKKYSVYSTVTDYICLN